MPDGGGRDVGAEKEEEEGGCPGEHDKLKLIALKVGCLVLEGA